MVLSVWIYILEELKKHLLTNRLKVDPFCL